jgi:VIT1/CCC1 family predicted Fe2+/Mn2+ transporter
MSERDQRDAQHFHTRVDPHHQAAALSDLILGGQDGLVNVLGVILGVAAATSDARIVLAAGLAAAFAESVSMGAVAYTTTRAEQSLYQAELERERRHVERVPELERDEVRAIYRAKGFDGELLERIVATITSDPEVWVAVMMAEELKLAAVPARHALRSAAVVGAAALCGSLIPLWPYLAFRPATATWIAVAAGAASLFAMGAYKALRTVGGWLPSGLEMAAIGTVSAFVGYGIGLLFRVG